MENKEYIWYCSDCNTIILKTEKPFLSDIDAEVICSKCGKVISFKELFDENKHNIQKYLKKTL